MRKLLWVALIVMLAIIAKTVIDSNEADRRRELVNQATNTESNGSIECKLYKKELTERLNSEALTGRWSAETSNAAYMVIGACK